MSPFVDSLEPRVLLAAAPTRYDVTIVHKHMTIVATGAAASVDYHGNYSLGGGVDDEDYNYEDATLTVDGPLFVNGRRQPGSSLVVKVSVVRSLTRIAYYGTSGRDVVRFDNFDSPYNGTLDLSPGAGDDELTLSTGSADEIRRAVIVGGAGDDRVFITGYGGSNLEAYTGAGRDKVYVTGSLGQFRLQDAGNATFLSITDAVFHGGVLVATGPQDDSLIIRDSHFTHNTSIRTQGDHDTLTQSGNVIPRGVFIDLGENQ